MVHGVPVVTTRQPELLEIVTPGEHVMMAKGKNAKSLYQEISKVLTDSKLSSKLIKNSKIRAEDFEMKDIVKQHLDQYIISINK